MTTTLIVTPGASATRDHDSLVVIDAVLSAAGVRVDRLDLPRSEKAAMEVVAATSAAARARPGVDRVVLGGRSRGGRMCAQAVAAGLTTADGLVLLSYPLHPPGKPGTRRDGFFPSLDVPCLFVSGTRDAFATPGELEGATAAIRGPVTHVWVEGGDHGMRRRSAAVAEAVRGWVADLAG